ncbi:hypothetical protein BH11ACT5_BH11ACT5_27680 [soil metagenome]
MKRALVGIAVLAVAAALFVSPPRPTLASWADTENSTGAFAALTVPPPVLSPTCTLTPGVAGLNPVITIIWSLPAGYAFGDVRYGYYNVTGLEVVTGGLLSSVTTTGTGPYTTKFGSGLLGGLLGGSKSVGLLMVHSSGWMSKWATITATMGLAGANPTCTVNPIV